MRRMREIPWIYWSSVIPLFALAFGVPYLVKKRYLHQAGTPIVANQPAQERVAEKNAARAPASNAMSLKAPGTNHWDFGTDAVLSGFAKTGNECSSIEYPGEGPDRIKVSKADWQLVMSEYHAAKALLLGWLDKRKAEIPEKIAGAMADGVREIRIQRPPAEDEPDLSWRGTGAYTYDTQGTPILRVGHGLIKMIVKQPKRGRFELARLIAQTWSPCQLMRVAADQPWDPYLKCLNVADAQACAVGSYSESGWAVSTGLAAIVAPPGCTVPAFASIEAKACLEKFPLPVALSNVKGAVHANAANLGQEVQQ